ncbi:hypothetical protein [Streptomyces sp. NPDC090994]|uniref:hypothetical protein n=1 Tax=Streptomyces sp. NPDC090994 TaxID=3365969 RepID=UPI00381DC070
MPGAGPGCRPWCGTRCRRRPRTTAEQVSGFALSAGRSVLTGGVGRMIHLARTNLRNIPRP